MATFGTFVDNVSLKATELNGLLNAVSFDSVIRQPGVINPRSGSDGPYGRVFRVNKLVIYHFRFRPSSSGSSNNRIELDLPVTAASNSMRVIGTASYIDVSAGGANFFRVAVVQYSTTRAAFLSETTTSLTTYVGQTNGPNFIVADGDIISGTLMYEAA
jgi:hypothetical protein